MHAVGVEGGRVDAVEGGAAGLSACCRDGGHGVDAVEHGVDAVDHGVDAVGHGVDPVGEDME